MQVPISSSVAGVVGFGASREAKSHAVGLPNVEPNQQIGPDKLDKAEASGDRDAQEQYSGDGGRRRDSTRQQNSNVEGSVPNIMDLPVADAEPGTLDLLG